MDLQDEEQQGWVDMDLMPWQHFQIRSHTSGHLMLEVDLTRKSL